MTTYDAICAKLGFDPLVDEVKLHTPGYEDDSVESPFAKLSVEELNILSKHLILHKDKLDKYLVK